MKKSLKNQAGAVVIVVILVIVLAAAGGGAAFLGIRMLVTGEPFLQPFEDLGWIELDDEKDEDSDSKKSKDDKKDKKKKEDEEDDEDEEDEDDNKKDNKKDEDEDDVKNSRLSAEAKKAGTDHYYGSMTMADSNEASIAQYADLAKLLKIEIDIYAKNDKPIEIVFTVKMNDFLKGMYDEYGDQMAASGYKTYEEFETAMRPQFESAFDFGFDQGSGNKDYSSYIDKYTDDGDIQIYMTNEGINALYDEYGIDDSKADVDTLIDKLEDSMGIKIEKVN